LAQPGGVALAGVGFLAHALHLAQQLPHGRLGRLPGRAEHCPLSLADRFGQLLKRLRRCRVLQLGGRC
jgi:hypothetical protein